MEEVSAALSWTLDHVAEYGGDPARVSAVGHSAGGHLVAWALLRRAAAAAAAAPPAQLAPPARPAAAAAAAVAAGAGATVAVQQAVETGGRAESRAATEAPHWPAPQRRAQAAKEEEPQVRALANVVA